MTARIRPSVSYSFTMRLRIEKRPGMFVKVLAAIAAQKGDPGAVDVVEATPTFKVRDLTVSARDDAHAHAIAEAVRKIRGVTVRHVSDRVFLLHLGGKIHIQNKVPVNTATHCRWRTRRAWRVSAWPLRRTNARRVRSRSNTIP